MTGVAEIAIGVGIAAAGIVVAVGTLTGSETSIQEAFVQAALPAVSGLSGLNDRNK